MCVTDFKYVTIGDDDKTMVMCREKDYTEKRIRLVAENAFPELFQSLGAKLGIKGPKMMAVSCHKMHSSQFDCQVFLLEKENNWDIYPYIALRVYDENGEELCSATPIPI